MSEQYLGIPDKEICSVCYAFTGTARREAWCKGCKNNYLFITKISDSKFLCGCSKRGSEDTTTNLPNTVRLAVKLKQEDDRAIVKIFIKRMLNKQDK